MSLMPMLHEIERAFGLAQSGVHADLDDLLQALRAEGYDGRHITHSPSLRQQLRRILKGRLAAATA